MMRFWLTGVAMVGLASSCLAQGGQTTDPVELWLGSAKYFTPITPGSFSWNGDQQQLISKMRDTWVMQGQSTVQVHEWSDRAQDVFAASYCSTCMGTEQFPMPSLKAWANVATAAAPYELGDSTLLFDTLKTLVSNWVQRLYEESGLLTPRYGISAHPDETSLFGNEGVRIQIILPSEVLRDDREEWDRFELTVAYGTVAQASGFQAATPFLLAVTDYRMAVRKLNLLSDTPSFETPYEEVDDEVAQQREEAIAAAFKRAAAPEISAALQMQNLTADGDPDWAEFR